MTVDDMRILAIDPGEKNIGLALSDPSGTIASPLTVIRHTARKADAAAIAQLAQEHHVGLIVMGQSINEDGQPTIEGRRAARLAGAIRAQIQIPLVFWDESHSTQAAQQTRRILGVSRQKRSGHLDDLAAAIILQSYLAAHTPKD
ncbi:MAG: Holliday junction resolvase RuvX [Anaerolineae bacterium]|nr:Holliday junction resolvase RuvX [Anaerolineae bacterium]